MHASSIVPAVLAAMTIALAACDGSDTDVNVDQFDVAAGPFIGTTSRGDDLAITAGSIHSIFFVCEGTAAFRSFDPPLVLTANGAFSVEIEHRGSVLSVQGSFVDGDLLTGAIDGDADCAGAFEARRCNAATQNCADRDGDLIPDEVDPNIAVTQPTTTPTFTPGGGIVTPTPTVTPTFTPGGGIVTPTPSVTSTFTPGGNQPTATVSIAPTFTPGGGQPTATITPTFTPGGGQPTPTATRTATPTPTAVPCSRTLTLSLDNFPNPDVNGVVVDLDYPSAASLPGNRDDSSVEARVTNLTGIVPAVYIRADDDANTRLRIVFGAGFETNPSPPPARRGIRIAEGAFVRVTFDCTGTPPATSAFSCDITELTDSNADELPAANADCVIASP